MRTRSSDLLLIAALATLAGRLSAQPATPPVPSMRGDGPAPTARPFSITRSNPALVAPDAQAELIATGFGLNEGFVTGQYERIVMGFDGTLSELHAGESRFGGLDAAA